MQRKPKAATNPPVRRADATDWGDEAAGAVKLASKTVGKVFSYILNVLLTLLLIGVMTGAVVALAFGIYVKNNIDPDLTVFESLRLGDQAKTTKTFYYNFTDRENRIGSAVELENMRMYSGTDRDWVKYADMPKYLIDAFTSIEDHRFWDHNGVDWVATAKATFWYFFSSGHHAGASTITQQLIKNVTSEDEITIQRKVTEILRALELEKRYDKTEIIELYLNYIFLSQHCEGVGAAAYKYFSKDVKDLSLLECAALAAIPKYPSKYDPVQHPENNLERRNTVLWTMLQYGKISQAEFDATYDKQLIINMPKATASQTTAAVTTRYSWYQEVVIDEALDLMMAHYGVERKVAWQMLANGGYNVYTCVDPEIQKIVEEFYLDDSNFPKANSVIQPQSAIAIVDPPTGDIVAIGGARGEKKGDRLFNYATAKRPPGSSIKPLTVYSPALQEGLITMASVFDDVPINFGEETIGANGQTEYSRPDGWPNNYPAGYRGLTTILDGVTRSVNTISLQVLTRLGVETAFDYGKNRYHLDLVESQEIGNGKYVTDKDLAPLGLGQLSYGVSVIEMAGAYATFMNGGVYNEPHTVLLITDSEGDVVVNNDQLGNVVLSEQNAFIMTMILQNVIKEGTAKRITIQSKVSCAGKTGTTQEDNDRWFCGFTPYYSAAVWFGYEMPKSLNEFTANPSVLIWDELMTRIHEAKVFSTGEKVKQFELADGIVTRKVCMDSGELISNTCYHDPRGNRAIDMYFTYATVPTEQCHTHVLVRYDKVNGGIATSDCPESECEYVGLLNVTSRNFPFNITVQDAQYTWREVPEGTRYTRDPDLPFYNCVMNGRYSGISYTTRGYQYNRICPHYDPDRPPETEPPETDPPETSPPEQSETRPPETEAPPAPQTPSEDVPEMPTPADQPPIQGDTPYYPEN